MRILQRCKSRGSRESQCKLTSTRLKVKRVRDLVVCTCPPSSLCSMLSVEVGWKLKGTHSIVSDRPTRQITRGSNFRETLALSSVGTRQRYSWHSDTINCSQNLLPSSPLLTIMFFPLCMLALASTLVTGVSAGAVSSVITSCTKPNTAAFTFDDGPFIYGNEIVDILDAAGAKGTWFVSTCNLSS